MKLCTILLGMLLLCAAAHSQSISLSNLDASAFPTMKGKFYAFDASGRQVSPTAAELSLTENGTARSIVSVTCPPAPAPRSLSSVLVVDVSGSMSQGPAGAPNIELARAAASAWVNALPLGSSECALTSFDNENYLNQDFTIDRTRLLGAIGALWPNGGTDYDKGLLLPFAGGLEVSKKGRYQKVIVFLTDGLPQRVPSTSAIIAEAQRQNCIVYAVTLGMPCPQSLKDISAATGGGWFEGLTTVGQAEEIYQQILNEAQSGAPCEITWQSAGCLLGPRDVVLSWSGRSGTAAYEPPASVVARLDIVPRTIYYFAKPVGVRADSVVTVTAVNAAFNVTGIASSNPAFDINPKTFTLAAGESRTLTVSYTPPDSSYNWTQFDIRTDACTQAYYASGGFPGKLPKVPLKLEHPNGREELVAGSDTVITWSGISPTDMVKLEYSTDGGASWRMVTARDSGLRYEWHVPNTPSSRCLARVTKLKLWGADDNGLIHTLAGHSSDVVFVAWSSDGRYVATAGDNSARIWDAESGALLRTLVGHGAFVNHVQWSPDGRRVLTASDDRTARIWDPATGAQTQLLSGHAAPILKAKWSPDGTRVATASLDGTGGIWNASTGARMRTLSGHAAFVIDIDWSPDGTRVATGSVDATAKIWDATTGGLIHDLTGHNQQVNSIHWSPDGSKLASTGHFYATWIWNTATGAQIHRLVHPSGTLYAAWSPDATRIATGCFDDIVRIWDIASGTVSRTLAGHSGLVDYISWSPDGSRIATSSPEENTAFIWNVATGLPIFRFGGHSAPLYSVNWSPDGTRVATSSVDATAKIWSVDETPPLTDVSDALFSIVAPTPASTDIDMGKVVVGTVKDSVVRMFVTNSGTYPFRVDSIRFAGAQAVQFEAVSGLPPFTVPAGGAQAVEFRFRPLSAGVKNAQIRVFTQTDTLRQAITGEGVVPGIQVLGNIIDFGQVLVNTSKDTLRAITIKNTGTAPLTVTNVRHNGPNAVDFTTLAGGGGFTLQPGDTARVDLRFLPTIPGRTSGQLVFEHDGPGSPTPVQLFGEGIALVPSIVVVNNSIDFGKVEVGKFKDSIRAVTITNVGAAAATITGTRHGGPNAVDFTTIAGAGPFTLQPGDTARLDLRFAPSAVGPTGGTLLFDHDALGSPATVQLIGEGIGEAVSGPAAATVRVANAEAAPGELVDIPITLAQGVNIAQSGATSFTVRLRFNATLLEPVGVMPKGTIEGEDRVIDLMLPTQGDADGVLQILKFRAGLGNDSVTALTLEDAAAVGGTVTMSVEVGEFRLLGICPAGGARLINPNGTVALKAVRPNPAIAGVAEVELETTEIGRTVLDLRDVRGAVVKTFVDGEIAPGRRVLGLDMDGVSAGSYFLTLRTPTEVRTIRLDVKR